MRGHAVVQKFNFSHGPGTRGRTPLGAVRSYVHSGRHLRLEADADVTLSRLRIGMVSRILWAGHEEQGLDGVLFHQGILRRSALFDR